MMMMIKIMMIILIITTEFKNWMQSKSFQSVASGLDSSGSVEL
jgi:hypothetical protein